MGAQMRRRVWPGGRKAGWQQVLSLVLSESCGEIEELDFR